MNCAFKYINYSFSLKNNILFVKFHFLSYFNNSSFDFFPSLEFVFPEKYLNSNLNNSLIDKLVFNLGMVESISYWKSSCLNDFIVDCHYLSDQQILWWKKLFFYGLGEFRYKNNILSDLQSFINFLPTKSSSSLDIPFFDRYHLPTDNIIVPIGGGKDSNVTMEELKKNHTVIPFAINQNSTIHDCITTAGFTEEDCILVNRRLDPKLLELNKMGALNGHTPFSALVAFTSLIAAELSNTSFIALSNESSANESTVVNNSSDIINHQYSKSFEFEKDFREFYTSFISDKYQYFSYLRPYYELKIAEKFSRLKQYYKVFKSCNVGTKKGNIWCGNCPKCLFVYIMFLPFIPENELIDIFGSDLLLNDSLLDTLFELTGISDVKPFECVGTISETKAAIAKYLSNNNPKGILIPYLTKTSQQHIADDLSNFYLLINSYNKNNFIPDEFKQSDTKSL